MTADPEVQIRRIEPGDVDAVMAAAHLFDEIPTVDRVTAFLGQSGWHLLIAHVGGVPAGFVSGLEVGHPDKATEMMLYELGVDEGLRRRGIGSALAGALRDLAGERRCRSMWVPIEPGNTAAMATYRAAGAGAPEDAVIMEWTLE